MSEKFPNLKTFSATLDSKYSLQGLNTLKNIEHLTLEPELFSSFTLKKQDIQEINQLPNLKYLKTSQIDSKSHHELTQKDIEVSVDEVVL